MWQFPTQPHAWSMWRGMAVPSTATRVKKVEGCGSSIHSHTRGEGGEVCLFPSHPHVKQVEGWNYVTNILNISKKYNKLYCFIDLDHDTIISAFPSIRGAPNIMTCSLAVSNYIYHK